MLGDMPNRTATTNGDLQLPGTQSEPFPFGTKYCHNHEFDHAAELDFHSP